MNLRPGPARSALVLSLAAIGTAMVSVQFGAASAKRLFPIVGAEGTTALRVGLAAVMLALLIRPWRKLPERSAWPTIVGFGVVLGLMNLCFYMALRTVPLGIAVGLEFTGPLAVAMFASGRWLDFLWIAVATLGLVALLPLGVNARALDPAGLALALGAGVFWGLYIILGKRTGGGAQTAALGTCVAALVVAPVGLWHAGTALFAPSIFLTAALVALFSSAIPYTLEMFALPLLPTRVFGALMSVEPAIAALMGVALLGEHLTLRQDLAIAAIILASLGTTLTMRREADASPPPTA